ncbi:hypothetical protein EJP02_314 [Escherichia phage EJP2]|nr:hypothetical protein EJP02_314 [Escherichia phage EJP2]
MEGQTFYNRILEDKATFDRTIYDLELMIQDAPNPRIRTQAELAKNYLVQVQLICDALKKHNND